MFIYKSCLDDFAPFIQLAATLNIAFVAVEYAKSYTSLLAKNIFKFNDLIAFKIKNCINLIDKQTVDNISGLIIDGQSTEFEVQELKRKSVTLTERADNLQEIIGNNISSKCQFQSASFISLYLSLFCFVALFCSGIGNKDYACCGWSVFAFLSIIFLAISFFLGEKKLFFRRLSACLWTFCGILALSIVMAIWHPLWYCSFVDSFWGWFVFTTALIPYSNFIFLTISIKCKARSIQKYIDEETKGLIDECQKFKKKVEEHLNASRLSVRVKNSNTTIE